ncbi:MAG: Uma2 family endonuclease [Bryobacteraceae bacterium]
MSSALVELRHKTWTRAEVETLIAAGHFEGQRFELIEGEIFDKMGQNPSHAAGICRLVSALAAIFGLDQIRTQLPVEPGMRDAPHSLPEPDVAVTVESAAAYGKVHPRAGDIILVAEVSDTTYYFDTKRKAKLYARADFSSI